MSDDYDLVAPPDEAPKRRRHAPLNVTRPAAPDGLPSLRVLDDPLLGPCVAAFGSTNRGPTSPFVARVLGPDPERAGRYLLTFIGSWMTSSALGGVGKGCGFDGASVVPVAQLQPFDTLDIRCGVDVGRTRGFYLWVPTVGLDVMTELDLRWALVSPFRRRLLHPELTGRGMAIDGVPGGV